MCIVLTFDLLKNTKVQILNHNLTHKNSIDLAKKNYQQINSNRSNDVFI